MCYYGRWDSRSYRSASNVPSLVWIADRVNRDHPALALFRSKRLDSLNIYNDILEFLKRHPDGCQVTRLSYGAGLPIDRINEMLGILSRCDLVKVHVVGEPLQGNLSQRRTTASQEKGWNTLTRTRRYRDWSHTSKQNPESNPAEFQSISLTDAIQVHRAHSQNRNLVSAR